MTQLKVNVVCGTKARRHVGYKFLMHHVCWVRTAKSYFLLALKPFRTVPANWADTRQIRAQRQQTGDASARRDQYESTNVRHANKVLSSSLKGSLPDNSAFSTGMSQVQLPIHVLQPDPLQHDTATHQSITRAGADQSLAFPSPGLNLRSACCCLLRRRAQTDSMRCTRLFTPFNCFK